MLLSPGSTSFSTVTVDKWGCLKVSCGVNQIGGSEWASLQSGSCISFQESGTGDHTPNSADINTTRKVTHRSVSGRSAPALILVYLSCFFLLFLSLLFHFSLILLAFNLLSLSRSFISCPSCTFPLLCHLLIKLSSMTGESKYDKGESSQVMWLCSQSLLALEEVTQIRYNNWISVRHRKKKRRGQE